MVLATLSLTLGAVAATAEVIWPETPDVGAPAGTLSGGTRGDCVSQGKMPAFSLAWRDRVMQAGSDRPLLLAYLPEIEAERASLTVLSLETGEYVGEELSFALPSLPAVVAVRLPKNMALKAGEDYRWSIVMECGNGSTEEAFADVRSAIVTDAPPQETLSRAQWYADRELWYDTLETLARAWENDPEPWQNFIDSWVWDVPEVFLEDLSALPEVPVVFVAEETESENP